ncbi:conjugal transfer protein TraB [Streptomyces zaomyceticus]|uniref:conjugal transfer protein TraB n=1 Tax=Streptomyces zaomyceticus TaxID=68286 RepID=UPI0036A0FD54
MTSGTVTSDDNRYKAIQAKLTGLSKALDDKIADLEGLRIRMRANAMKAQDTAQAIEHADLDVRFVEMTNAVSIALGGAAAAVRVLTEEVCEGAASARQVRRGHEQLYGRLDEIRSNRREKTPKPGFLDD